MKNTSARNVRKPRLGGPVPPDQRVRRTRRAAHDALIGLARERPFDSIAVQDILNRADIARSTFYMHFGNKHDVLESGIIEMLRQVHQQPGEEAGTERVIGFSLPFVEHINRHREGGGAYMPHGSRVVLHQRLETTLADLIAEDLNAGGGPKGAAPQMPADLLGRHIASTFVLVLNWWLDCEPSLTPARVDARFRELVLPLLATV